MKTNLKISFRGNFIFSILTSQKKIVHAAIGFCLSIVLFAGNAYSQSGMWTWISGSNTIGTAAVFGTQGVPSVNNHPEGAYQQICWKDLQGNFWLYGGTWPVDVNDMWKYNPVTNEWTWIRGSGGVAGLAPVYGTIGVSDPANDPGARGVGTGAWTDFNGNFWLFGGGITNGVYGSDLWKYEISTNEWTWMKGPMGTANGVHGIQGVPDPANNPGGRVEAYANWIDNNNNLWLFGGYGYDDTGFFGFLNDLMMYNTSTGEWTWMKGSNLSGAGAVYGTLGVPAPTNDPGKRWSCSSHLEDVQGNFWLFGGTAGGINGFRNDMWRYDPLTNEWTWMSGTQTPNSHGNYQTMCDFNGGNIPSAKAENRACVTDNCGNFWFYGGLLLNDNLNDLWVFDPVNLQWNWLNGSSLANTPGNWGTLGVPSPTNTPGGRYSGVAWWGNDGKFYTFGGPDQTGIGYGDLWKYDPDSCVMATCSPPIAMFTSVNHICPGTCTDFVNLSSFGTSYLWIFNGSSTPTSTDFSPQNICYNIPGTYSVTLIAQNINGSDTLILNNYLTVYPSPLQSISQNGDTLIGIPGAASYQWYFNGNLIPGATGYYYVASQSGDYNLIAMDVNGCEVEAVSNNVIAFLPLNENDQEFLIYPNPADEKLTIRSRNGIRDANNLTLRNVVGETILVITIGGSTPEFDLDLSQLPGGLYFLDITSNGKIFRSRFVKN